MTDPLRQLKDEPMRQPHRTLSSADLPDSSDDYVSARQEPEISDEAEGTVRGRLASWLAGYRPSRRHLVIAGAALVLLLGMVFGGQAYYNNYIKTTAVTLTVSDLRWERGIEVEELRTLTLEDWNVPGDGRVISSRREIRSYRQVLDRYETRTRQVSETVQTGTRSESYVCGTEDTGNGFFRDRYCTRYVPEYQTRTRTETYQHPIYRQEPIYDTKYTYQVDRWSSDHYTTVSGTEETQPYWPVPEVNGPRQRVGDERIQHYLVTLIDPKGDPHKRDVSNETWSRLDEGETVVGHQARSGNIRRVDWPQQ